MPLLVGRPRRGRRPHPGSRRGAPPPRARRRSGRPVRGEVPDSRLSHSDGVGHLDSVQRLDRQARLRPARQPRGARLAEGRRLRRRPRPRALRPLGVDACAHERRVPGCLDVSHGHGPFEGLRSLHARAASGARKNPGEDRGLPGGPAHGRPIPGGRRLRHTERRLHSPVRRSGAGRALHRNA